MLRQDLLDLTAEETGQRWAAYLCDQLAAEGRAAGGWPGTLGEARAHVGRAIAGALRERGMLALTHAEHGRATHLAYDAARRAWLQVARLAMKGVRDDDE